MGGAILLLQQNVGEGWLQGGRNAPEEMFFFVSEPTQSSQPPFCHFVCQLLFPRVSARRSLGVFFLQQSITLNSYELRSELCHYSGTAAVNGRLYSQHIILPMSIVWIHKELYLFIYDDNLQEPSRSELCRWSEASVQRRIDTGIDIELFVRSLGQESMQKGSL